MRSATSEQSLQGPAEARDGGQRLPRAGPSYLERLGIVYSEQIRLTIVAELYMREMGVNQFFQTIGGSSYDSVRRHFHKLVEYGWLRKVRTAPVGPGRPEVLYRSTELPVIDTETWRALPFSIRDAFTVQLLEEMGARLGEALDRGTADIRPDRIAAFETIDLDEAAWAVAYDAVENCFHAVLQEQTDAKIRLDNRPGEPILMVVNLAAFEAPGPAHEVDGKIVFRLPKPDDALVPPPWSQRIGRVFTDRLDLRIVDELNDATMTAAELETTLGGADRQGFLRRCKRLTDLGWAVNLDRKTGGRLHGARLFQFRAAAQSVSEREIFRSIPAVARKGLSWEAFERFILTSIDAVDAGTFNSRFDRHLTMSPLLVDEIGWIQVTEALRTFQETLLQLDDLSHRRSKSGGSFRAAFLLSSFEAPLQEIRK